MTNSELAAAENRLFLIWQEEQLGGGSTNSGRLLRATLRALHENLTQRQRDAIELYYLRSMSMPQIAAMWGVSVSAVSRMNAKVFIKRLTL